MLCLLTVTLFFSIFHSTRAQWSSDDECTSTFFEIRCKTQNELVKLLRRNHHINTTKVANVMLQADRKLYVPYTPYVDDAKVYKAFGRIDSPPHMIAFILETLKDHLTEGKKALDVGSCSGYLTMCMALMVGKTGFTLGVEQKASLVKYATDNVAKDKSSLLFAGTIKFEVGRVLDVAPQYGPFDVINVAIPSPRVPEELLNLLNNGGRMLIVLGNQSLQHFEELSVYDKDGEGNVTVTQLRGEFVMHFILW